MFCSMQIKNTIKIKNSIIKWWQLCWISNFANQPGKLNKFVYVFVYLILNKSTLPVMVNLKLKAKKSAHLWNIHH